MAAPLPPRAEKARSAGHLACAALSVALLGSCGLPDGGAVRPVDDDAVPYNLLSSGQPTSSAPRGSAGGLVDVFLASGAGTLRPVLRPAPAGTPLAVAQAALEALQTGPTSLERRSGLTSVLVPGSSLEAVRLERRTLVVDVVQPEPGPPPDRLPLLVGQIVLSVTSVPGIDRVVLTRDGTPLEAPLPDGALTAEPLTDAMYLPLRE